MTSYSRTEACCSLRIIQIHKITHGINEIKWFKFANPCFLTCSLRKQLLKRTQAVETRHKAMQYIACNIFFKVSESSKVHYLLPDHFRTPRTSHANIKTPLPGARQTYFCSLKKHMSSPSAQQASWVRTVLAVDGSWLAASKNANTGATAFECSALRSLALFVQSR